MISNNIRAFLTALVFFFGYKLAAANMTTQEMIINGVFFFSIGCSLAIYIDKHARGFPNEFNIPTRKL